MREKVAYGLMACAGGSLMGSGELIAGAMLWVAASLLVWPVFMRDAAP